MAFQSVEIALSCFLIGCTDNYCHVSGVTLSHVTVIFNSMHYGHEFVIVQTKRSFKMLRYVSVVFKLVMRALDTSRITSLVPLPENCLYIEAPNLLNFSSISKIDCIIDRGNRIINFNTLIQNNSSNQSIQVFHSTETFI